MLCPQYLKLASFSHEHSLKDLGEISQVERVVRLGRRGEELGGDGGVDSYGSRHNLAHNIIRVREVGQP